MAQLCKMHWRHFCNNNNFILDKMRLQTTVFYLRLATWEERQSRDLKNTRDISWLRRVKRTVRAGDSHVRQLLRAKKSPQFRGYRHWSLQLPRLVRLLQEHQPPRCQLTLVISTVLIIVHFKHREGSELSEPISRGPGVLEGSNTWQALVYSGTSYFLHSTNHRRCCNEVRSKNWAHPHPESDVA